MKTRIVFILTTSLIVGIVAAGVSLILPNQFTAKGILIVSRKADPVSQTYFTYEGHYASQNSGAYTGTFLAILHSPNNLKSTGITQDVKSLGRLVKTKREGSQAIILTVKGKTPQEAGEMWEKISGAAIQTHDQLKVNADPLINVTKTPNSPVIIKTYPAWQPVLGASFLFSLVILSSLITIIRYLKEERDY